MKGQVHLEDNWGAVDSPFAMALLREGSPAKLLSALQAILDSDRILSRPMDLITYASDAGFYHLVPQVVVQPVHAQEIRSLFLLSQQWAIPLVFRTGGTSLSGQSITDGILVDLSKNWNKVEVLEEGRAVRVQPGITGAMVNQRLKKWQRKIGPDPSSISAAMMGGILSNNASGMCCGVQYNSYHTLRSVRFMLPNGQSFDTGNQADYNRFVALQQNLADTLLDIKAQIQRNQELEGRIREKYRTKNTVGYSLNAFLDFDHPLDIMAHLLIGGEGTLAWIEEAVLETLPDPKFKATSLLYFPDIFSACNAIQPLIEAGAVMVELMDDASLRAVQDMQGMDPIIKTLPEGASALLIEFQETEKQMLHQKVEKFLHDIPQFSLLNAPVFTEEEADRAFLWKVRKGLFPAVGAVRASGTTVILEDVAFPLPSLGAAILDLQVLFKKYHYHNAIIFGHAKDGNIHFVVTQAFVSKEEIERYQNFMEEVVELVVKKYNGALKAEHGTGRNMAPFVETEWGGEAYEIMKRLKSVVDPQNLLNPGVIINPNPQAHLMNLKHLPTVEEEVDRCIECGYCEPVCPSKNITQTPRRRIVARRAIAALQHQPAIQKGLIDAFQYEGLDTCAVDGLCGNECPVYINTGDLVKRLRAEKISPSQQRRAHWAAAHFHRIAQSLRGVLFLTHWFQKITFHKGLPWITRSLRKIFPQMPLYSSQIRKPPSLSWLKNTAAPADGETNTASVDLIYFSTCISRVLGGAPRPEQELFFQFKEVLEVAQLKATHFSPEKTVCCGQIFSSKGFRSAFQETAKVNVEKLWAISSEGKIPIVLDVSSCKYTLDQYPKVLTGKELDMFRQLKIMDMVDYIHTTILPRVELKRRQKKVVLHPVCALKKLGNEQVFHAIAQQCAEEVVVPISAGCCGMAGDRGFLFPELTHAATLEESKEVLAEEGVCGYYSSTKTCEMAMEAATGKPYVSILSLLHQCIK